MTLLGGYPQCLAKRRIWSRIALCSDHFLMKWSNKGGCFELPWVIRIRCSVNRGRSLGMRKTLPQSKRFSCPSQNLPFQLRSHFTSPRPTRVRVERALLYIVLYFRMAVITKPQSDSHKFTDRALGEAPLQAPLTPKYHFWVAPGRSGQLLVVGRRFRLRHLCAFSYPESDQTHQRWSLPKSTGFHNILDNIHPFQWHGFQDGFTLSPQGSSKKFCPIFIRTR